MFIVASQILIYFYFSYYGKVTLMIGIRSFQLRVVNEAIVEYSVPIFYYKRYNKMSEIVGNFSGSMRDKKTRISFP